MVISHLYAHYHFPNNATTQTKREIERVHNYWLYIANVSIKHKAVDHLKFWFKVEPYFYPTSLLIP